MLKAPVLGTVKTRLAKSLGEDGALRAYRELVEFLLGRLKDVPNIHIHFAQANQAVMEAWLGNRFSYFSQVGNDLGERLINALHEEFRRGADKLIFLGGDCPYVDQERLDEAFAVLDSHEVVLGPATDGGYYLIGLNRPVREVFENIPWGTGTVLARTIDAINKLSLTFSLLPAESDVDNLKDWNQARTFMAER